MEENARKNMIAAERMAVLQAFVDCYLIKNYKMSFAEMYPDMKDEYGKLNSKQNELLHNYLDEVYKEFGLNLSEAIKAHGENYNGTDLTDFETNELTRLADNQIGVLSILLDRKARLLKK